MPLSFTILIGRARKLLILGSLASSFFHSQALCVSPSNHHLDYGLIKFAFFSLFKSYEIFYVWLY
jgi:hypothetical protein